MRVRHQHTKNLREVECLLSPWSRSHAREFSSVCVVLSLSLSLLCALLFFRSVCLLACCALPLSASLPPSLLPALSFVRSLAFLSCLGSCLNSCFVVLVSVSRVSVLGWVVLCCPICRYLRRRRRSFDCCSPLPLPLSSACALRVSCCCRVALVCRRSVGRYLRVRVAVAYHRVPSLPRSSPTTTATTPRVLLAVAVRVVVRYLRVLSSPLRAKVASSCPPHSCACVSQLRQPENSLDHGRPNVRALLTCRTARSDPAVASPILT